MAGSWYKQFSIAGKLLLISLTFSLPIAVLFFFTLRGINAPIQFATLEMHGNAYQRPLERLLDHIGRHKLLAQGLLTDNDQSLATKIDRAFQELEAIDSKFGVELQFTEEGLGKRQRQHARVHELKRKWDRLHLSVESLKGQASDAQHDQLFQDIRTMITHAGDTSNLILDPDLDSYYLMDITLLALPQTQDRLVAVIAEGAKLLQVGKLATKDKIQLTVHASLLRQADMERVVSSARNSLVEDPNYYGVSSSLKTNLEPALQRYMEDTEAFLKLMAEITESEAPNIKPGDFVAAGLRARDASFNLWGTTVAELDKLLEMRISAFQNDRQVALALTGLALLISLGLVYMVGRSITKPIHRCVEGMQALATRDLTKKITVSANGELGMMARAVNQAMEGVNEAVSAMRKNTTVLSGAADDMTSASHQMSANAEETSTQATVVASAAEEINKSVQTVASASEQMSVTVKEVARQAQEAARVATEGVKMAQSANAIVTKLGDSSQSIGNVVKVITSIAEQTNLLALNATIEAARAGEVGKGFAVVANEVKELAKQTAQATEVIGQRIETIQGEIQAAVASIGQISTIINHINDTQTAIATAVEEQNLASREIGRNLTEAARGTSEIARNITGVAEAAHNTSEGAHKTERAAAELAHMAAQFKELVGHFKSPPGN